MTRPLELLAVLAAASVAVDWQLAALLAAQARWGA